MPFGRWRRREQSATGFGRAVEAAVARWLERDGVEVLARNHRNAGGEIDLVVRDGDTLAFVEVKARSRADHGGALAAVDREKRRRLQRAATVYLAGCGWEGPCRFDVVAVERVDGEWRFRCYENAFEVE
ncbi:MAG TPA: YraN family protein [Thermoanaerobaculia bacterium]|nr:YraN family protein [Thermoanaerobaculia bacterium]